MACVRDTQDAIAITESFQWRDGRRLFDTNEKHLHSILRGSREGTHVSLEKWSRYMVSCMECGLEGDLVVHTKQDLLFCMAGPLQGPNYELG